MDNYVIEKVVNAEETAKLLLANIRDADLTEMLDLKQDPYPAIVTSITESVECYQYSKNNKLGCVFGVCNSANGYVIWMIATKVMDDNSKDLVKLGMDFIRHTVEKYKCLHNVISTKNIKAIRYIKRAGARLSGPFIMNGTEVQIFTLGGGE